MQRGFDIGPGARRSDIHGGPIGDRRGYRRPIPLADLVAS